MLQDLKVSSLRHWKIRQFEHNFNYVRVAMCSLVMSLCSHYFLMALFNIHNNTVPLTLNLTHACVCTRACTHLTCVKVNNLACIVSVAREFGVRTNARGTLDMHDTNMPATCTRFAI